jgi:hypothetical protein
MQIKWIVRRHFPVTNKWQFLHLSETGKVTWNDNTPTSCTRFDEEGQAALCLSNGAKELHWGGVHVVEKVYVL